MIFPRILRLRIGLIPRTSCRFDSKLLIPNMENAAKMLDKESQHYLAKLNINMPKESEVGKALGKDLPTKIKDDLGTKLHKIQSDKSEWTSQLDKLEMKNYMESIERLSSNKYALMYAKDEQKSIDRLEHVRENFIKMPYNEHATRLASFDAEEMAKMDPAVRKKVEAEDYENLINNIEKAELFMLNHNEKVSFSKRTKYRLEQNKALKQFKKDQRAKYEPFMKHDVSEVLKTVEKTSSVPSIPESRHKLHLETRLAEDVTAEVIRREDLTDEFTRKPWDEMKAKRYRGYLIMLSIFSTLPYYAYCEYKSQQETGGFQGVFLGMNIRVL